MSGATYGNRNSDTILMQRKKPEIKPRNILLSTEGHYGIFRSSGALTLRSSKGFDARRANELKRDR